MPTESEVTANTTDAIEETAAVDTTVVEGAVETTPPEEEVKTPPVTKEAPPMVEKAAPVKVPAHYVSFFEQYLGLLKDRLTEKDQGKLEKMQVQSIKALNNCLKSMIKANTNEAINAVFKLIKANREALQPYTMLQGIAILPSNERAVVEVMMTIFTVIANDNKATINLETARAVVKSELLINWCAKKLG